MGSRCDFCKCDPLGPEHSATARCADGRVICDICYNYDVCTPGRVGNSERNPDGQPCPPGPCRHRPELVGDWEPLKDVKED